MELAEANKLVQLLRHRCAEWGRFKGDLWRKIDAILADKKALKAHWCEYQRRKSEVDSLRAKYLAGGGKPEDLPDLNEHTRKLESWSEPWPDWCYMPVTLMDGDMGNLIGAVANRRMHIPELMLLSAWRQTQGVYLMDETVLEELWKTPLTGKIPVELLHRLPEWSVLINLPPGAFKIVGPARMVLCQLTAVGKYGSLIFMLMDEGGLGTLTMPLLETLEDSCRFILDTLNDSQFADKHGIQVEGFAYGPGGNDSIEDGVTFAKTVFGLCAPDVAGMLSALLYMCSEEPDIQGKPRTPVKQMTKNGPRYFPPDRINMIDVGLRLGSALRRGREVRNVPQGGTHASPRPHIRGAHWHTFLTGPRSAPPVPRVKWLPPIPVNTKFGESQPVARPVEGPVTVTKS